MQRGEVRNPVMVFVICAFTCGIGALWWIFNAVQDVNKGLGREEFNFLKEIGLTFITCGLWGLWFQWRFCEACVELQKAWGVEPVMDAPILLVLNLVGIGPIFIQQSLNNAWENGTPGGAM